MTVSEETCSALIVISSLIGLAFAGYQFTFIHAIRMPSPESDKSTQPLHDKGQFLHMVYSAIEEGAKAFLAAEYTICAYFVVFFSILILFLISWGQDSWSDGFLTMFAFIIGAATSILSGYIGMRVAVYSNVRTTIMAQRDNWYDCFNVAFRAGGVMGFALTGNALLVLYLTLLVYRSLYFHSDSDWDLMMDCISGYGLGGSTIALFGRVGGGIYTKAADVGADLVGKVIHGIPEDDPRNPATIADNVGDNVGDVAGMGADLFGSFAESTCAALVIAAQSPDIVGAGWAAVVYPMAISAVGILVCLVTSFLATNISPVNKEADIETVLKYQLIVSTVLVVPAAYFISVAFLPDDFEIVGVTGTFTAHNLQAFGCVSAGAIGGLIIGLVTEYFTSNIHDPVKEVANACITGAATNIIFGLALGYKSVIIPVFVLSAVIFSSFQLCDLYGVALGAIGMLTTLATGLTIDAYGPVCDNAGGIAEMAQLEPGVREKTDALDAAGNTTAAIGKGFAIGSAALVSLALYGAFVTRLGITDGVNILEPLTFSFLLIGSMLPYWFSAMTMKSVGLAAREMVAEIEKQYAENPRLLDENTTERPDYTRCVDISAKGALKEMIAPGALVMLSPLIAGTFFGVYAVFGILTGGLVSGVQMAISMSNSGGAWDNAKKLVEKSDADGPLKGKGSDVHKASVVGDTVGDPLKDTSGPSLNILMKLMAIISLVFAEYFDAINDGKGLFNINQSPHSD